MEKHRLSPIQRRLWTVTKIDEGLPIYHLPKAFFLKGTLDLAKIENALNRLGEMHPELRMAFAEGKEGPELVIQQRVKIVLIQKDLKKEEAEAFIDRWIREPIPFEEAPLMRAILVRLDEDQHILAFNWHHLIIDGQGTQAFLQQFSDLYNSSVFPPNPRKEAVIAPDLSSQALQYWKEILQEELFHLEFPKTNCPPQENQRKADRLHGILSPSITQKLINFTEEKKTTLFITLLSAYAAFLYRYCGQGNFVVGYPADFRSEELKNHLGVHTNTLPMRFRVDAHTSFQDILNQTAVSLFNSRAYQGCPVEEIVNLLQLQGTHLQNSLYNVDFFLENSSGLDLHDVVSEELYLTTGTVKSDLSLRVFAGKKGIRLCFEYATSIFSKEFAQRLSDHFQFLLNELISHPDQAIAKAQIMTPSELHRITVEWNQTQRPYPSEESIPSLFEKVVNEQPEHVALRFQGRETTYRALNEQANQLAHCLQSKGVKKGDFVGISMERSPELIIGLLGILKAGAVFVSIDTSYPADRQKFMIEDCGIQVHVTPSLFAEASSYPCTSPEEKTDPLDVAMILYTSGSTGRPKGVQVLHRGIIRLAKNSGYLACTPRDRFAFKTSISFDISMHEVWGSLLNGACLCIMPQIPHSFDDLEKFYLGEQISHTTFGARFFNIYIEKRVSMLQNLRYLFSVGEAMSVHHANLALQSLPNCHIVNAYGPTENAVYTTLFVVKEPMEQSVFIGRPIDNTTVYILDQNRQPVPIGVPGELCTGGDGLARGYLNRKDLTDERFIPNPFGPGKLYRTGDLAQYLPDGNIVFLGRIDNQVKIRGNRIEPGEVENVLSQHPSVRDCVTLAREVTPGEKVLVAYIKPKEGKMITSEEIREYAPTVLPKYMIPDFFLVLEQFPATPHGKIDRKAFPLPLS